MPQPVAAHHTAKFSCCGQYLMFGPASHLCASFPVNDDGILNEAVNEERTQQERTEVEDERVRRDSLMKLMEMKRKQREQRKRYCEKHPEILLEQNRSYCKKKTP